MTTPHANFITNPHEFCDRFLAREFGYHGAYQSRWLSRGYQSYSLIFTSKGQSVIYDWNQCGHSWNWSPENVLIISKEHCQELLSSDVGPRVEGITHGQIVLVIRDGQPYHGNSSER
jgi:hypothetical protein